MFWDELGVYGPSVYYLMENGIDIQPKALDPELSRGHPMLYVFANALVGSLTGESLASLHLFNLSITLFLLLSTFFLGRALIDSRSGLLAVVILAAQPILHAQATLILPEMALSLAIIWMLYAYWTWKPALYTLAGIAAVWTKETAIFIPFALWVFEIFSHRGNFVHLLKKSNRSRFIWISVPWFSFVLFLILQKVQNGWILFPYHTGLFDFTPTAIAGKLGNFLSFLFWEQGRFLWSLILLTGSLVLYYRKSGITPALPTRDTASHGLIASVFMVIIGFSSTNAYLNRYLLLLFPLIAIVVADMAFAIYDRYSISMKGALAAPLMFLGLMVILPWLIPARSFAYDEHPNFVRYLELTQLAVDELMTEKEYAGSNIQCNWPIHSAIQFDHGGYRKKALPFYLVGPNDSLNFQVRINPGANDNPPSPSRLDVYKVFTHAGMTCTIYKRR